MKRTHVIFVILVTVVMTISLISNLTFALGSPSSRSNKGTLKGVKLSNEKRNKYEQMSMLPSEKEYQDSMSLTEKLRPRIKDQDIMPEKPKVYQIQLDPQFAVGTFSDPNKLAEVTSKATDRFFRAFVRYLSEQMYDWSRRKD